MTALLAAGLGAWSFGELMIAVVVVLGVIGIVYVAAKATGVPIPQWLVQILLIVVVVVVAVVAIKFLIAL